jgi:hypothetical protein
MKAASGNNPISGLSHFGIIRWEQLDPRHLSAWRERRTRMGKAMTLCAYIERAEATDGSDAYVAGLRGADGGEVLRLLLPADAVECAVLRGAHFSVMLSPCGRLTLDAEGLSEEALEVANAEAPLRDLTLERLVRLCLEPALLKGEDNLPKDLDSLHDQLQRALQLVDETRSGLPRPPQS